MSFNTGNPLPSKDILDLYDNSETIDNFVNSQQDEIPDRFGTKRLTLAGLIKRSMALRNEINDFSGALTFKPEWSDVPMNVSEGVGGDGGALNLQAEALGNRSEINKITSREALRRTYQEVGLNLVEGSFEQGGTLNTVTDIILEEKTGKSYSWSGSFPKVVAKGSLPTGSEYFLPRSIDSLHLLLNKSDGWGNIGVATYSYIRNYSGDMSIINCSGRGNVFDESHGIFFRDDTDVTSLDDDGTVFIDRIGRRWKRQYSGAVNVRWFGAIPGDETREVAILNTEAFRKATLSMKSMWESWKMHKRSRSVYVPSGDYNLSNGFCVPKGCSIFSDGLGVSRLKILSSTSDTVNILPLVSLGRVINEATMGTEVSHGAYVIDPPPFIDNLYLNPQNSNTAIEVNGVPGFRIGTLWIQANKGVVITGGSGDGIIGNIFAEDSTGYGIEFGFCQNIIVDNLYTFLCNNPVVYSGDSNNTNITNVQANYTKIATVQTLDYANPRGAKISSLVSKHNSQYESFRSVIELRSTSCDLTIAEMDARNYNGYALNNATGLGNSVHIGFLRLRQRSFSLTDSIGVNARGCRVSNMSLSLDKVDISELGFSPFEFVGAFNSSLEVRGGRIGGLNAPVPVCNIENTSPGSNVILQVEPPTGLALFNLQSIISPTYNLVRNPFPVVEEGGRKAIKVPFIGNSNSWRVTISANTNSGGNGDYERVRRLFIIQETTYNSTKVTNVTGIDDGKSSLDVTYTPDISYQLDLGTVGTGPQKPYTSSGYIVISVPRDYTRIKINLEQAG